jgi:hypothetical protein
VKIEALTWRSWSMSFSTLMTTRCAWGTGRRAICAGERISNTCAVCSAWGVRHWPAPPTVTARARHGGAQMSSGDSGGRPAMRSRPHDARLHVPTGHADRAACAQRARVLARDAPAAGDPRSCQRWDRVRSRHDRTVGADLAGTRLLAGVCAPCTRRPSATSAGTRRASRSDRGRCLSPRRPRQGQRSQSPSARSGCSCTGRFCCARIRRNGAHHEAGWLDARSPRPDAGTRSPARRTPAIRAAGTATPR